MCSTQSCTEQRAAEHARTQRHFHSSCSSHVSGRAIHRVDHVSLLSIKATAVWFEYVCVNACEIETSFVHPFPGVASAESTGRWQGVVMHLKACVNAPGGSLPHTGQQCPLRPQRAPPKCFDDKRVCVRSSFALVSATQSEWVTHQIA